MIGSEGTTTTATLGKVDSSDEETHQPARHPYVVIIDSLDRGQVDAILPVESGGLCIGRSDKHHRIADPHLSRAHLTLKRTRDGVTVHDLESRNGTFVNGKRLPPGSQRPLANGEVIRIGDTLLVIRYGRVPTEPWADDFLPGLAPGVLKARDLAHKVGARDVPVLIQGETGTGKEFAARALHTMRAEPSAPFVPLNCARLTRELASHELFGSRAGAFTGARGSTGVVVSAEGGTLLLDEIGDLEFAVQGELLRFLQESEVRPIGAERARHVKTRVVAATNVDLRAAVARNRFRADLLARLEEAVPCIKLPPLRERREDLGRWTKHFLKVNAGKLGFEIASWNAGFLEAVLLYSWPTNLRELRSVISESMLAAGDGGELQAYHLPDHIKEARRRCRTDEEESESSVRRLGPDPDKTTLIDTLTEHQGNMLKTAKLLGIDRRKLYRLCKSNGVQPDDYRVSSPNGRDARDFFEDEG